MRDSTAAVKQVPIQLATRGSAAAAVERALRDAVDTSTGTAAPPSLRRAIEHAVFPGGARLRPLLCMAVAGACGAHAAPRAIAAAAAVELVHCASLVHDDLPCFDDASLRRNRPTVHVAFGEALAVLVGDALLCMAFETLARAGANGEGVLLAGAVGPGRGLIAGQAWESEATVDLDRYHRAKTGALFEAAAGAGAMAAGVDAAPWRVLGEVIGRAYQAADDIADATRSSEHLGKTSGRDAVLARPSAVRAHGLDDARRRLRELLQVARSSVPRARAEHHVHAWLDAVEGRLQGV